jgi:RimJ/RimL family protein N-acetyltransferase
MPLQGPSVLLRSFRPDEFERVWAARTSEAGYPPGLLASKNRERTMRRLRNSGRLVDGWLDLGIEVDGRLVGEIDARRPEGSMPPGVFELGISLFEESDRGKGYGGEAVELMTTYLFSERIAERVQASTSVSNVPMRRVFERLGFVHEGTMRGFMPTADGRDDYALYAVTRADWTREPSSVGGNRP